MATTAKQAFATERISLQDGTEITLRPLSIKKLREFNKLLSADAPVDEDTGKEDHLTKILELAVFCVTTIDHSFVDDKVTELEDTMDLDTAYEVIRVVGGVELNAEITDADFLKMMESQDESGTKVS